MNILVLISKPLKNTSILLFFIFTFTLIFWQGEAHAAGEPNSRLPNNGGYSSLTDLPELVVGRGGYDANQSEQYLYVPEGTSSLTLYIDGACDGWSKNDVAGWRATTRYRLWGANISSGSNTKPKESPGTAQSVECETDGANSISIVLNNFGAASTVLNDASGVSKRYSTVRIAADVQDYVGSGDYENSFSLRSSVSAAYISYVGIDGQGLADDNLTGIYNRISTAKTSLGKNDSAAYWSTEIEFASKCGLAGKYKLYTFDNDTNSGGYQSDRPINADIQYRPRGGGSWVAYKNVNLAGGNNVFGTEIEIDASDTRVYKIRLSNIYSKNAIQIALPFKQIWSKTSCENSELTIKHNLPSGNITVKTANGSTGNCGSQTSVPSGSGKVCASGTGYGLGPPDGLRLYAKTTEAGKTFLGWDTNGDGAADNNANIRKPSGNSNCVAASTPSGFSPTNACINMSPDNNATITAIFNDAAPTCSPATQTVFVNTLAKLSAKDGDGNFSWSASNGSPSKGSAADFSVKYSTTGNKTVVVKSNGKTKNCTVVVQAKASCSPQNQTVVMGQIVSFSSSGGDGSYNWSAPGGSPSSSNSGSSFSTSYSDYGQYKVDVTTRGDTATCNVNVTVPNCQGIRNNNAGIPGFPSAVKVTLTNGTTSSAPSGNATSPNQSYNEYKRNGIVVNSVSDTSPDGFHNIDIEYNDFSQSNNNSYANVNLDYRPFVVDCPYDTNRATVNYTYKYKRQNWQSSSSPTGYDCPNGGIRGDNYCYKPTSNYCPTPYESGGTCYQNRDTKRKTLTGGCSTSGIGDFCGYQYSNPQPRVYYCQGSGWTQISQGSCRRSARPLYQWNKNGGESNGSQNMTKDGATMEPCDRRTYSAESVTTNATLNADHENPTSSTINGKIRVDFGVRNETTWNGRTNMRRASSVALPYRFEYKRTTGSWTEAASGNAIITSSSRNKNSPDKDSSNLTTNVSVQVPGNILPGQFVSWRLVTGGTSSVNQRNGTIDNAAVVMSSSDGTDTDERITPAVENWPYIKVFGNDVVSGGEFSGCNTTAGGVETKYRSGAFGSASQYGIFSIGSLVKGFVSSGLKGNTSTNPNALTFANTTGTGTYGGNFNGSSDQRGCLPDYFSNSDNSRVTQLNSSGNNVARGTRIRNKLEMQNVEPDGKTIEYYKITGNVNLKKGNQSNIAIQDKSRKVIYVDGTIWIDDNIVSDDTWNKKEEIPFTMFIARNVVIHRSVTSVDAVFVAQGSSDSTGNIWTCDENTAAQIFSSCNGRLQINGALIAKYVHFMRSFGSLRDGTNNEGRAGTNTSPVGSGCGTYGSAPPSSTGTNGGTTCASEVVSFSPDVYLILSEILTPGSSFKYDSYVNAAPNL